jgi:hypothetical protein
MGFQRHSLKFMLSDIIGGPKTTYFSSDKGSRYGVLYTNSRGLLLYKDAVMESLTNAKELNSNAEDLKVIIEQNWKELALAFGAIIFYWVFIISPFHSLTSKKSTVRETIEMINMTQEKIKLVTNSDSPYDQLYSFRNNEEVSIDAKNAIEISFQIWNGSTQELKDKINAVIHKGNAAASIKFSRDTLSFDEKTLSSNAVYILNNRHQESAFSTLKSNDKKYLGMLRDRLGDVAICQRNKCAVWLRSLPSKFSSDIIKEAKSKRKERVLKRKNNSENARLERLRKYSRISLYNSEDESSEDSGEDI